MGCKTVVFWNWSSGGAERQALQLARYYKCSLLILNNRSTEYDIDNFVNVYFGLSGLWECLKGRRKNVYLFWMPTAIILGRILKLLLGICTVECYRATSFRGLQKLLLIILPSGDVACYNSRAIQSVISRLGIYRKPGYLVRNFLPDISRCDRVNMQYDYIMVAQNRASKDFATVIEMHKLALSRGSSLKGCFIGKNVTDINIESLPIDLFEHLDNVHEYMCRSRCVVLSSMAEGTPNVILEALILGIPYVMNDLRELEILHDEYGGGLLFKSGSSEDLFRKVYQVNSELMKSRLYNNEDVLNDWKFL